MEEKIQKLIEEYGLRGFIVELLRECALIYVAVVMLLLLEVEYLKNQKRGD